MNLAINDATALPSDDAVSNDAAPASAKPKTAKKRLKILMIEDDEADAYLIKRALRSNRRVGKIVHVRDGVDAAALVEAQQFRPDLALVDLHMPRKDGFSLLLELGLSGKADFPAVVLSSSRAGADRIRARIRGAVQFVTKPNSLEKMTRALDDAIASI